MTTVERLCSVLGPPQALHEVTDDRGFLGAVGRWSHQGAKVDLRGTDTVQVIFNVSGGQRVKQLTQEGSVHQRTVRAGSIALNSPNHASPLEIQGRADTVQMILSRNCWRQLPARRPPHRGCRRRSDERTYRWQPCGP